LKSLKEKFFKLLDSEAAMKVSTRLGSAREVQNLGVFSIGEKWRYNLYNQSYSWEADLFLYDQSYSWKADLRMRYSPCLFE